MSIPVGGLAPRFTAATVTNPRFPSAGFGGRYVLLAFLPATAEARQGALGALAAHRRLFDDVRISAFGVLRDEYSISLARDQVGLRWFLDRDGAVSRLYDALGPDGEEAPGWVLIDPFEVVLAAMPLEAADPFFALVRDLPEPADHAGVPLTAPVLVAPRILDPDLCRRLVAHYDGAGGEASGVMREIGGKTVAVLDDYKRRRDATITDEALIGEVHARLVHRLLPQIQKAFQFRATQVERNIVACYDAADGGYFLPHRDDTTKGTAHRRFACTINLNTEDYEGGDLRFPEFGPRCYRAPTGGAVVFSCSLLHEATPVTRGRRYAYLPFLYDDAAAAVRAANLDSLAQP
jgi:predicted 2-oxoglutarate/Fe(II)-dependent dioxygenase YbiX